MILSNGIGAQPGASSNSIMRILLLVMLLVGQGVFAADDLNEEDEC